MASAVSQGRRLSLAWPRHLSSSRSSRSRRSRRRGSPALRREPPREPDRVARGRRCWRRRRRQDDRGRRGGRAAQPPGRLAHVDRRTSPGRLLTYLEASLARARRRSAASSTDALSAGIAHAEAAGLLAEAVGGRSASCSCSTSSSASGRSGSAWALIEALLRYAPARARRAGQPPRDPAGAAATPSAGASPRSARPTWPSRPARPPTRWRRLGKRRGGRRGAVEATGGWVTGVLFEAWRSAEHVAGMGGEADPLHGYLASQILAQLADPRTATS